MLDDRTTTTGVVLCEQMRTLDIDHRSYSIIEEIPVDLLQRILNILQRTFEYDGG